MDKLNTGLGIWQIISSNIITDIISKSGFKITLMDLEHGIIDKKTLQNLVFTARNNNLFSIARLPSIYETNISQVIDTGIDGVLFPHIEDKSQIDHILNSSLLPPHGSRGFSPFVPRFDYGLENKNCKKNPFIGVLIESIKGINNCKSIIESPFIDFVYFGAYDISVEIEKPGQIFDKKIREYLEKVVATSNLLQKKTMAIFRNKSELEYLMKIKVTNPIASVDTNLFISALSYQKDLYDDFCKN